MKHAAPLLMIAFLAGSCVYGSSMDMVHAGMSPGEVTAKIGPPDVSTNTAGRQCDRYTVMKDFMSRVPWDMSDPYYVCYTDGKVDSFGRATVAHPS
jgi:hypothetical protein